MKIGWQAIVTTVIGVGVVASLGAAVDTRDQTRDNRAEIKRVDDVQSTRYQAIIDRLDRIEREVKK